MTSTINFNSLVQQIEYTDRALQTNARLVINRHVTVKAWLTGYYIVEYEQKGEDRAKYGEKLIQNLSKQLGAKKFSATTLKIYRQFYVTYPQLSSPIAQFLTKHLAIGQSVTDQLVLTGNQAIKKSQSLTDQFILPATAHAESPVLVDSFCIFNKLSFTHLVALLPITNPLERAFYETMAIKGTWSSRELERQIDSNYFIRTGWSKQPEQLVNIVQGKAEIATLPMDIKSPFVFEFLGLKAKDVVEESDLETALMDNLQDFILELGMGFCFEERQKKLLIDDRYYKADLVFYHRVLKRHVIHSEREEYWETACDEYWWNNNQYTESGDYEYYTTTDQGCERVEILHLTINRSERQEYSVTACDQYDWHGEVYTESGTYEYHTTTEQGCERVEVLYLTISDREHEEYYETACDEFYWNHNGQTYYESGDYIFNTTAANGCERTEVLHLTINHSEREEYYETACDAYEWHGNTYTESGDYEYYTTTDQGCERVEVLHLTINRSEREEYNVIACDQYEWHGEVYTESGTYEYHTTTDQGCERVEVLYLTISDREHEEYYETACDEFYWDHNGETYYESGDYIFNTTAANGCERTEVLHLTINRSEREEYYENGCDVYEWHGNTYTESGDYEYRTTLENGCERVEVLHLTIYNSQYEEYWETACDEYWWNGNQYTESGDYTYSYPLYDWGTGTCDRTEVLHLTINKRDTVHYYETACDEYWWDHNGQYYNISGDYENYTTNEYGCERVEILHLTINYSQYEEYWETACDAYEWQGNTYTKSGDYEYRSTTEQGCERVEMLHLTINHSQYEEYNITTCDQYEWHGETYTESGDYEYRTTLENGCERVEVLHLTLSDSEREEYNITACDSYEWHGETYTESGDYEYRTTIEETTEKLYVGYDAQNDPIIGLVPPRGVSKFTVDGYITNGSGCCFVGTGSPENGIVDPEGSLRIFDAGCFYYDRMSGRNACFFDDYRNPFNIEFGNYYAKNLETSEYYFNEGNNVYEYSNTEYPLTLFYNDYGKIHKVQFFDNNNLLWADINAVVEGGVPMITIDYYNPDGSIYHTQQFTENLHAETKTITEQGCERVEILHLTINRSEREEYYETACDSYEWNGLVYTESGDYTYTTTTDQGCERVEVLHLTINRSEREEYNVTACDQYEWHGEVYTESGTYEYHTTTDQGCERVEILHLTILPDATTESETLALCPSELPYEWYGQVLTEAGTYSAAEQYAGMECDSVIHELTLDVYVQTLPATVTLPIVRTGEAIDVSVPTAEIQAHIAAETWYAPNAEVAWYIMDSNDWGTLTDAPVAAGITEVILKYAVETDCGNVESDKMVIIVETTDVENIHSQSPISNCQKILYEDHIYILRDGKIYSVMGQEL